LAICPCHRTCYDKYTYGYFNIENDKIVDILANNTAMAIRVLFSNNNLCSLKCDSCLFRDYCLKGCFGAQLETNKDPFIPIKSVCDFFEKKYVHLI
jgi:radical SAM protein with 4Fe4S-binding SPASM domain